MSGLEWVEEPPAPASGGPRSARRAARRYDSVVDQLAAAPGRWAIVGRVALRSEANGLRNAMDLRGCEAKSRREDSGVYVVYARCPV